jgi:hypothetical protein
MQNFETLQQLKKDWDEWNQLSKQIQTQTFQIFLKSIPFTPIFLTSELIPFTSIFLKPMQNFETLQQLLLVLGKFR